LAANLDVPRGSVAVDLGCGCGILAIIAAKLGAKFVYAVDVNPHALEDTRFNASINGVADVVHPMMCDVRRSKGVLNSKVDVIISNPPQKPFKYQAETRKWLSIAQNGGATGRVVLDSIISQAPEFFRETYRSRKFETVVTSLTGISTTLDRLESVGFNPRIVASSLVSFNRGKSPTKKSGLRDDLSYQRAVVVHAKYVRRGV
jgi:HemK-related putative methylase